MPQTHQDRAEGTDHDSRQAERENRQPDAPKEPSLLGPKGDPAEGKPEVGSKPN